MYRVDYRVARVRQGKQYSRTIHHGYTMVMPDGYILARVCVRACMVVSLHKVRHRDGHLPSLLSITLHLPRTTSIVGTGVCVYRAQ